MIHDPRVAFHDRSLFLVKVVPLGYILVTILGRGPVSL